MGTRKHLPGTEELSDIIRRVDGNHALGAGALADAIIDAVPEPVVRPGTVIQFTEDHHWTGSIAIVSEVRGWGVQAYVPLPQQGLAYVRATSGQFAVIGDAVLAQADDED